MRDDVVELKRCIILSQDRHGAHVLVYDTSRWIPLDEIDGGSAVDAADGRGTLIVKRQWAEKRGLV